VPDGTDRKVSGTDETGQSEWLQLDDEVELYVRVSDDAVVLEGTPEKGHRVPRRLEIKTRSDGEPDVYARIEVDENGSKLTELCFKSTDPDARGIRQSDLREVEVTALLEHFVAMFTVGYELVPVRVAREEAPGGTIDTFQLKLYAGQMHSGELDPEFLRLAQRLRHGRPRDITPQLLERVAEVYRANIHRAPTKAVQHHFQVSQRMAAEYVSRARQRGVLPPTVRGKKQA
jgi:hypothetical protein